MEEQFLGSSNQASKLLHEGSKERCMDNFWLLNPHSAKRKIDFGDERESCLGTLQRSGNLQWGTRKKVLFVTKQRDTKEVRKHEESKKSLREKKESDNELGEGVDQGLNEREKQLNGDEIKRENTCTDGDKPMEERREPKPKELERNCRTRKGGWSRWSAARVEHAEKSLVEVIEKMGATWDKPVLRADLRSEARKCIGDTGLLDHLLIHMVGVVVADGKKRFARQHNPQGKIEYWLEPADQGAGITNPVCNCHGHYKKMAYQLKEEVNLLRRENEDLKLMILQSQVQLQLEAVDQAWKEKHDSLLKQHQKLQEQFSAISTSLLAMKEVISSLKAQKEKRMPDELDMAVEEPNQTNLASKVQFSQEKGKVVVAGSEMVNTNGFNMCNPQHTILQPNMATSGRSTPYSTSSATSAPPQSGMNDFGASQMDYDELLVAMAFPTEINSEDQSFDVANLILESVTY
ncbi:Protein DYAD [Rhynchospora pubera]|uniref:Protein DYAD n=1 Tax=Rhynchospora pubera TaxID=906938 RepID=A0AAV8FV79_9POAL|nr:Protein DYAD [Rhynchospora pubera]